MVLDVTWNPSAALLMCPPLPAPLSFALTAATKWIHTLPFRPALMGKEAAEQARAGQHRAASGQLDSLAVPARERAGGGAMPGQGGGPHSCRYWQLEMGS